MYAISFDLVVADTAQNHPKGVSQAYADIGSTLQKYGFSREWINTERHKATMLACTFGTYWYIKALAMQWISYFNLL